MILKHELVYVLLTSTKSVRNGVRLWASPLLPYMLLLAKSAVHPSLGSGGYTGSAPQVLLRGGFGRPWLAFPSVHIRMKGMDGAHISDQKGEFAIYTKNERNAYL